MKNTNSKILTDRVFVSDLMPFGLKLETVLMAIFLGVQCSEFFSEITDVANVRFSSGIQYTIENLHIFIEIHWSLLVQFSGQN